MTENQNTKQGERAFVKNPHRDFKGNVSGGEDRGRGFKKNFSRGRKEKSRRFISEFSQKLISVRRVARVVAGGRRFSFSVAIVLGDKKGGVGVGLGKGADTASAIEKAIRNGRKNMIRVKTTPAMSIAHEVDAKFGSARLILIPAKGRGLVAGSSVRNVLDLAGLTNITAKILSRSKNKLNNARATIVALQKL
ncbi:MAG: 30S ribosomal protein S5 [bacterium]|nr:30S ribosomal protein S5 [bacterium]